MTPDERTQLAKDAFELFQTLHTEKDKHGLRLFTVDQATQLVAAAIPTIIQDIRGLSMTAYRPAGTEETLIGRVFGDPALIGGGNFGPGLPAHDYRAAPSPTHVPGHVVGCPGGVTTCICS